jgi:ABC-type cobalamin/Fe3+-siderophores transport system ATPase subunit
MQQGLLYQKTKQRSFASNIGYIHQLSVDHVRFIIYPIISRGYYQTRRLNEGVMISTSYNNLKALV